MSRPRRSFAEHRRLTGAVLALALLGAACGDDDGSGVRDVGCGEGSESASASASQSASAPASGSGSASASAAADC